MSAERCVGVLPSISSPGLCLKDGLAHHLLGCLRLTVGLRKPGKETGLSEMREDLRWKRSLSVSAATVLQHPGSTSGSTSDSPTAWGRRPLSTQLPPLHFPSVFLNCRRLPWFSASHSLPKHSGRHLGTVVVIE